MNRSIFHRSTLTFPHAVWKPDQNQKIVHVKTWICCLEKKKSKKTPTKTALHTLELSRLCFNCAISYFALNYTWFGFDFFFFKSFLFCVWTLYLQTDYYKQKQHVLRAYKTLHKYQIKLLQSCNKISCFSLPIKKKYSTDEAKKIKRSLQAIILSICKGLERNF